MKIFNNTKRRAVSAIAELLLVIIIIIIIIELQEAQLSLFRTVSEIFRVNNGVTLIWIRGHSRSLQMAPFSRSHTSSYWRSIVTMTLSCIVSEIRQDISQKSRFFHTHLHATPPLKCGRRTMVVIFDNKVVMEEKFNRMSKQHHRHRRQSDRRQTEMRRRT